MEKRQFFGCRILQRDSDGITPLFMFFAHAKDVHQWAGIRRLDAPPEINQRVLRETRSRAVTQFFRANPLNLIPNSVLLAFDEGSTTFVSLNANISGSLTQVDVSNNCDGAAEWGYLEFQFDPAAADHDKPAQVVDGQHRLEGMSEYSDELTVLLVGLLDASRLEQAFQFIVINRKAVGVPTENVKSIIADFDDRDQEQELSERLLDLNIRYGGISPVLRQLNDSDLSPFQALLNWDYNRAATKIVPPTALEQSLRHLKTTFHFFEDDEDSLLQVFMAIWRGVKEAYPELWGQDNKLMNKICIIAFNSFLSSQINFAWLNSFIDIFQVDNVTAHVKAIASQIPREFWETEWNIKLKDTPYVKDLIQGDLDSILQNTKLKRPAFKGLSLIEQEE